MTIKQGVALCVAALLLLGAGAVLHRQNRPQCVYVNLKQVLAVPIQLAAKRFDQSQQVRFVKAYSAALPKTLKAYGKAHHVTIIAANLLYDPQGLDRTGQIIQLNLAIVGGHDA